MNRIIPHQTTPSEKVPEWLNMSEVVKESAAEVERNRSFQKTASEQTTQLVVAAFACPSCTKTFSAEHEQLQAQANLAEREKKDFVPSCPSCNTALVPYSHVPSLKPTASEKEGILTSVRNPDAEGPYNTFVDRHLVYKAVNALERFASKVGMHGNRVRYLRSEHVRSAGQDYPLLNNIECEIQWNSAPKIAHTVQATVVIDAAGLAQMPKTFKVSSGEEMPFEKASVEAVMQPTQFDREPHMVHRRSDSPTYKRPDITNFRSMGSKNEELAQELVVESSKKKEPAESLAKQANPTPGATPAMAPPTTAPQQPNTYQPGTQVVNPLDGKTYNVKTQQSTGVTLVDPQTQQESIVPQDQVNGLRPAVKTTSFSIDAIVQQAVADAFPGVTKAEIETGAKEELEHTDDKDVARQIAVDHVAEDPEYYEKLKKVEEPKKSSFQPSLRPKLAHVETMSQNWQQIRKSLLAKAAAKGVGYAPEKPQKDKTGHDRSGVPLAEEKEVTLGLTEFPKDQKKEDSVGGPLENEKGYRVPFKEMDENQVTDREHFHNEEKLPFYRIKREQISPSVKTPEDGKKKHGLEDEKTENPGEDTFVEASLLRSIGLSKEAAEPGDPEPIGETAPKKEVPQAPIQHKPLKKAPGVAEYKEPEVIETAGGKLKEAITKFRKAQTDISDIQAQTKAALAPIEETMKRTREPLDQKLSKAREELASYLNMVYEQLGETKEKLAAYEDTILARVERLVEGGGKANLQEVLDEANRIAPELFSVINKIKEQVDQKKMVEIVERTLYDFPVSKTQERKIVQKKSSGEMSELDDLLNCLTEWLDQITSINKQLVTDKA
jgi:ElaB/YqjD/DUF883 family membrane-anchored ribosome-binding protein